MGQLKLLAELTSCGLDCLNSDWLLPSKRKILQFY